MPAFVDTMFSVREKPWHGLGVVVKEAVNSKDAIKLAGLDWRVEQKKVKTEDGMLIDGTYCNVRSDNGKPLGIVKERYTVVQNEEAFEFADNLLGEGVTYETAGSLKDGRQIWLLARMPENVKILGDEVTPYLVLSNTHDGSGSVRVAMTPVRVVCNNTLNLALKTAKRTWSARHMKNFMAKTQEAKKTLEFSSTYMRELNASMERLDRITIDEDKIKQIFDFVIPVRETDSPRKLENKTRITNDILHRFHEAPDLQHLSRTSGARFMQAVADSAFHAEPSRKTKNYKENAFARNLNGNEFLDKTLDVVLGMR